MASETELRNEGEDEVDLDSTDLPEDNKDNLKAIADDAGADDADGGGATGDDADGDDKEAQAIPYQRFKKVNDERRTYRDQNAALLAERERLLGIIQGQQAVGTQSAAKKPADEPAFDFDAANEELADAIIEGDKPKVRSITAKIRAAERAAIQAQYEKREEEILAKAAALSEGGNLRAVAASLKKQYPFLDNNSDEADEDAIQEVIDLRDLYIKRGEKPGDALTKATQRVAKLYGKEPVDSKPKKTAAIDSDAATKAKAAAVARNASTVGKQPPPLNGGKNNGTQEGAFDPEKMDKDEWAKLPDKERERYLYS